MRRTGSAEPAPYDFRRPAKLSRDHTRLLQVGYETFARRLTTQLTTGLRQVCQVNLVAIEQQTYEEYTGALSPSTTLALLDLGNLPGTGIWEFSLPTALACVDYLLGGTGGEQPTRGLTDLETPLVRGLIGKMLEALHYGLETTGIAPTLAALEFSPQFLQIAGGTDLFVVGSFELRIGKHVCLATLALPLASVLPRLQTKADRRPTTAAEKLAAEKRITRIRAALGGVPVGVSVRFEATELTPSQLLALVPGDVIPLNHRVTTPLSVVAGDQTFAHALAGRSGTRLAGLVVATPKEKSS